jgi:uncharacterized protein YdbL (DUF1318 family)
MTHSRKLNLITVLILITGCVTVNVYFPAAAAEQAADRIIREIYGDKLEGAQPTAPDESEDRSSNDLLPRNNLGINLLNLLIPAAQAQEANMDISSPAINALKASMTQRHAQLEPFYLSGAIGMDSNALLTLRDPAAVSIRDRNIVNQLVAGENQDRNALYSEIARANSHPEWEAQIRSTFARRWVANAPAGWYFQDASGSWQQK